MGSPWAGTPLRQVAGVLSFALLLGSFPTNVALAGETEGRRVALVLSGGGARGFAHIGILRAFEEDGIPIDMLTGTSMGAIVGTLFAAGYTPEEIRQIVLSLDWVKVFSGGARRSRVVSGRYGEARGLVSLRLDRLQPQVAPGLLPAQRVYEMLLRYAGPADAAFGGQFDSLMIPIRIVAADLKSGQLVVFKQGDLAKGLLASMAIPFIFAPVQWGDSVLVDGGLLDNTPVDVARRWGADVVIAVDVSSIGERDVRLDNLIDIFRRTMDIWMTRTNRLYAEKPDVLLRPYLEKRSPLDYPAADTLIALGYHYARSKLDTLRELTGKREDWKARRTAFRRRLQAALPRRIADVGFVGNYVTRVSALRREVTCREGQPFDIGAVCRDVHALYETGLFDHVFARFKPSGRGAVSVKFEVKESARASIHLGASYRSRDGEAGFIQIRHRNLLGYGDQLLATWRLGPARRFVALETQHRHFLGTPLVVRSALYDERARPWLYENGRPAARASIRLRGASLSAGVNIWNSGLLSLSGRAERGRNDALRTPRLDASEWRDYGVGLEVALDTRDDAFLPSTGCVRTLRIWQHGTALGGSLDYRRVEGAFRRFFDLGRLTLAPGGRFGLTDGDVPRALWFRLGGAHAFQGYDRDELWTPNFATAGLAARYDYNTIVRFSLVASANWHARSPGRLFRREPEPGVAFGIKLVTPAGPAEFNVGYGEGGRTAVYFSVGYPF
ncbi:MAG: BamA/TamA family outer membrane protein [Calditrichaeota bacterium]|nr:BamA/TamA family outer membrane protein [Calditrichota bacterium]